MSGEQTRTPGRVQPALGSGSSGDPNSSGQISESLGSSAAGMQSSPTIARNAQTISPPAGAVAPGPPETRQTKPPEEQAQRLFDEVQKLLQSAKDEALANRRRIAEFNFQTISVLLALLTLVIAVPFVLLHGANVATGVIVDAIFALLFADSVMAGVWLYLWWRRNIS